MNIIIYNINSFGGNYEYAKYLFEAYQNNPEVKSATLLMPENAVYNKPGVLRTLCTDLPATQNKLFKKIHYLYRSMVNPFRLLSFLKKQPSSIVIFNDFDQRTAWFWAPFFKPLKKKHKFAVILHDPDRDKFFSIKSLSETSMSSIMAFMDVAFFHGFLPDKSYYNYPFKRIDIPHGIYDDTEIDNVVYQQIKQEAVGNRIIGILGNIRDEKNYNVVIDALAHLSNVKLLIAGKAAHSGISSDIYKQYATEKGVSHKILWQEGYLSQGAFNACIAACDIVLLYYKPSFTSQSGVLNTIAPFKKKLIISNAESSLKKSVEQYTLGRVLPHDQPILLAKAVEELLPLSDDHFAANWDNYIANSSWQKHVSIAVTAFK